ncbi:MAG TPA: cytochrome c biogenesis CcdA family protein [Actinomycetota bacterium]|nr:cytochrome c biogenesis CcdA family protein [Actinomycetota bacterium]
MIVRMLVTFGAGLVGFLSPCVLPLLPGYVGYMTGAGAGERVPVRQALPGTLAFVGGLSLVFVSLGAGASVISVFLIGHKRELEIVSGIFVLLLGSLLVFGRMPAWLRERRFHVRPGGGAGRTFLLGMAFAFGWTPCIGPTLGAALTLASTSGGLTEGIVLLGAYSLGLGLPFVAAGLGLVRFGGRMKRHAATIQMVGGLVLVGVGVLMLTGRLTLITIWMQRVLGGAGLDFWNV